MFADVTLTGTMSKHPLHKIFGTARARPRDYLSSMAHYSLLTFPPEFARFPSMKAIVVGGGWSGCAASLSVHKQGAEALLLERTDMLFGTGLDGRIMQNNGRFAAAEEMIAMSGGKLFQLIDQNSLHRGVCRRRDRGDYYHVRGQQWSGKRSLREQSKTGPTGKPGSRVGHQETKMTFLRF